MADIRDLNELWNGHSGYEVETFLKRQLSGLLSSLGGKFGAVAIVGTDLVFYDEENGNVLGTVPLSGQTYTVNVNANLPQAFYILADETSKVMTISPTTTVSSFGSSVSESYPEPYEYIVAVNTGDGYVNRLSGSVAIGGSASFDLRPYLAVGDNYIRVTVTGTLSNQTRSVVYTGTLTTLTMSCTHSWQNVWSRGQLYNIVGIRFAGSLVKTLHVSVNDNELATVEYPANVSYTTTSTYYTIPATAFPGSSNSVCSVKLWMTAQGVSTPVVSYNIMCAVPGDTTPLVGINAISPVVYNYSSGTLFSYAVHNADRVSIGMSATLNSVVYDVATGVSITGRDPGVQYPFFYSVEVDTGANETKNGSLAISVTPYMGSSAGRVSTASTIFDNSYSYLATPGALFYLNAATRDNGAASHELIVNEATPDSHFEEAYSAVWSGLSWYNDGWATDSGGRRALSIPAGCTCTVTDLAPLSYMSFYPGMTVELLLQNASPSDYETPVLTILSGDQVKNGIEIYPTKISVWGSAERNEDFQTVNISENRITHVCVTFVNGYEGESGKNLCSIYINGISNSCFSFDGSSSFGTGCLVMGQPDTDLYLYKMRVYGFALEAQSVFNNFINCVFDGVEFTRTELVAENDVLDGDNVDYTKVKMAGYNTMVVTTPDNVAIPSFFNDVKVRDCSVRFEYADDSRKNVSVFHVDMDGQGTTSKKYFRWNLRWKTSSNTSWSYGDGTSETGKVGCFVKDDSHARVDRITAKKNIASSPQGHKMGLTGLYNDLFHAISSVADGLPDEDYRTAVYQFPFVGFQYNTQNGQYEFIGVYTAGPDKGSKVTFGYDKTLHPDCLSIEGPNHAPRGTRFLAPWADVTYDPAQETLCFDGDEGWDCDYVKYETSTDGTQADWDAIRALYESEWRPAYECVYNNSPYVASADEVIRDLDNPSISDLEDLLSAANANVVKAGFTNGMTLSNEYVAFYDDSYELYYYRTSKGRFQSVADYNTETGESLEHNILTALASYLGDYCADPSAPTTEEIIAMRSARFKADAPDYFDIDQTLFHYCFCILYGVTDNFAKNSYPQIYKRLSASGAGNRWGWRQDDLDSVLMTDNNGTNTKKYSVEHLDTFDGVQIFQGGDSALWRIIHDDYETEVRDMMVLLVNAAVSIATSLGIQGSGDHESLFNLTSRYCWEQSAKYFPITIYEKERRWSYIEPWLLAGTVDPSTGQIYPGTYNGVAPLTQAVGDQYQGERLWMERRIAYLFSKYRIGAFTGTNTGYNAIVFTLARNFTFDLTPAIDLYPVVSLVQQDSQAGRTLAGTDAEVSISTTGDSNNTIHGGDWLADLGDLSGMRLTPRAGSSSIDFYIAAARLQKLKIGDADASVVENGFNATGFGVISPSLFELDARNTVTITNNVDLLGCPRLRKCLFAGSGAAGILLPVGAKLTEVSFPSGANTVFMHSLPFLDLSGLALPTLSGITSLYINNCAMINPLDVLEDLMETQDNALAYATLVWRGSRTVTQGQADALVVLSGRTGYVSFENGNVTNVGGTPYVEGYMTPATTVSVQDKEVIEETYEGVTMDQDASKYHIVFEDANVESVCLANYDTNSDGKIELNEAKAVGGMSTAFDHNTSIVSFNEFKYFTHASLYSDSSSSTFWGCTNLVSIILPSHITSLARNMFYGCSKLSSINQDNIVSISGVNVFRGTGLEEVNMPNLATLGGEAFYACSKLKRVISLGHITTIPDAASSGYGAFRGCSALVSVTLPETLTKVGSQCFNGIAALVTINFPETITTIGAAAFMSTGITNELYLPNLTSLGNQAFRSSKITKILSLGHLTSITGGSTSGDGVFRGCTSLTTVTLHNGLTTIGGYCFAGCTALTQVTTPSTLVTLGPYVFQGCSALQNISLPYLTTFGVGALQTSGITSIELPSIVTIGNTSSNTSGCFYSCTRLTHVDIGANCTMVGDWAFRNCSALDVFVCRATTPPTLGASTFSGAKAAMKIYVPYGYGDIYKAATNWNAKAAYINELDENGNIPT